MSNYQNHQGGNKFELLTQKIFKIFDIAIDLLDYEEFPELQNAGIDAFINKPDRFKGLSLQIKMFRNVQKYGTFPWEVSRFLTDYNSFVDEPHKADFHLIIDPVEKFENTVLQIYIFKTGNKPEYFQNIWKEAILKIGEASESNKNWSKIYGKLEPYYKVDFKNETLYQLIKPHTAYQRNVRFRLRNFTDIKKFEINFDEKLYKLLSFSEVELKNLFFENNKNDFEKCKSNIWNSFIKEK